MRGRRGHPGVHEQHAGAGCLRRLCRNDQPIRLCVLRGRRLQHRLPAAALRHGSGQRE
jgi:hypothetical protein